MTEKQMLKMQETFTAAGRNCGARYIAIAKSTFEQHVQQIGDCKRDLDSMAKALNDTASLTMLTQFCNEAGVVNWDEFAKIINQTTPAKSREAGTRGE